MVVTEGFAQIAQHLRLCCLGTFDMLLDLAPLSDIKHM
jgi:hypothetical protein